MWDWLEEAVNTVSGWWDAGKSAVGDIASGIGSAATAAGGNLGGWFDDIGSTVGKVTEGAGISAPASTGVGTSIVGDWAPTVSNAAQSAADVAASAAPSAATSGAFGGVMDPQQFMSWQQDVAPVSQSVGLSTPSGGTSIVGGSWGNVPTGAGGAYKAVKDWAGANPEYAKLGIQWAAGKLGQGSGPSKTGTLEQDASRREAYEAQKNQDANTMMGLMRDPYAGIRSAATMGVRNAANEQELAGRGDVSQSAKEAIKRKGRVQLGAAQAGEITKGFDTAQTQNAGVISQASGLRAPPQARTDLAASYGADQAGDTRFAESALDTILGGVRKKASDKQTNESLLENKTTY